ncbi:hypothetical protein [Gorillibacterium massiliense]|uniref:hypothetical protein n=1 Tax=Gorillibacterium massiliense TaxID=1280390 RepID=UPI000693B8E4|nr:hypothetical protein [Gorillibacterium massiliense]
MNMNQQRAFVIFNKLFVNTIEDSSGIFIGTNQAIGWSSSSKTNQGFGTLQNSTLSNIASVVYDSDVMDASIDDATSITLAELNHPLRQCAIDFNAIHANVVTDGSAIDLGDNTQLGWRSSLKSNYGFGKSYGSNRVNQVVSMTVDDDAVDAPIQYAGQIIESVQTDEKNIRITQKQGDHDPNGSE